MLFPVPAYTTFTIPTGATVGARIVFNQDGSGTIRVYDASNVLVDEIGGTDGHIISYGTNAFAEPVYIELKNGTLFTGSRVGTVVDETHAATLITVIAGGIFQIIGLSKTSVPDAPVISFAAGNNSQPLTGTPPRLSIVDRNGTSSVLASLHGALTYGDTVGSNVPWQTPTYNAQWAGATSFEGVPCQTLRFRLDAQDNLWLNGAFAITGAGAGASVFALPAGYFNSTTTQFLVVMEHTAAATFFTGGGDVSTAGNFNINLGSGFTRNNGDEFYVNAKIPLGNLS